MGCGGSCGCGGTCDGPEPADARVTDAIVDPRLVAIPKGSSGSCGGSCADQCEECVERRRVGAITWGLAQADARVGVSGFWREAILGDTFLRATREALPFPLAAVLSADGVVGVSRFCAGPLSGLALEGQSGVELSFSEPGIEGEEGRGAVLTLSVRPPTAWQEDQFTDGGGLVGPWSGGSPSDPLIGEWPWLVTTGVSAGTGGGWLLLGNAGGGGNVLFQQVPAPSCMPTNITIDIIKSSSEYKAAVGKTKSAEETEKAATALAKAVGGGDEEKGKDAIKEYMDGSKWSEPTTAKDGTTTQSAETPNTGYLFVTKLEGFGEPGQDCLFRQIVISEEETTGTEGHPGYNKKTSGFGKVVNADGTVKVPYGTGKDGASEDIPPKKISETPILDSHSHSATKAPVHYNIRLRDQVTIPGDEAFKEEAIVCRDYVIDWKNSATKGTLTVTVEGLKKGQKACKK